MLLNLDCRIRFVLGVLSLLAAAVAAAADGAEWSCAAAASGHVPVIHVTDFDHPPQDVGENFDLLTAQRGRAATK